MPQPLLIATDWGRAALPALALLFAAMVVAGAFYGGALRRVHPLPLPATLLLCTAGAAMSALMPVLFSSDVYAYAAYGEMARIGLNPYAHIPPGLGDPIVRAAQWQWVTALPICTYGPAFVALARGIVTVLAPFGLRATLDAFRVVAVAALLLCVTLAFCAYPGDRRTRLRAAASIGLSPVAIWCAAEGHNDALALAVVLAGFALLRRQATAAGAMIVTVSALIKAPGIAAAIALAIVRPRTRIAVAAAAAIVIVCSLGLITGVIGQLAPHGRYAPQGSVQAALAPLGSVAAIFLTIALAVTLALHAVGLLRRGQACGWIALGLAAWVLVPNPYPWYSLWLIALAAMAPQTRAGAVAIGLSFSSLLRYIPDAVAIPSEPFSAMLGILGALPLLGLLPLQGRREYNERLV